MSAESARAIPAPLFPVDASFDSGTHPRALRFIADAANNCKHVGYEEFNPPSWPSSCAPNKDQWVLTNKRVVCGTGGTYPEEFWQCSDISLVGGKGLIGAPVMFLYLE